LFLQQSSVFDEATTLQTPIIRIQNVEECDATKD
jgi:hypothetical protein